MDKLSTMQDKELVALLKEDSQQAFGVLYARYKGQLMYFCKRMLKDEISAEDIVHDTFLQLWETRCCFHKEELNLWGYLRTLAKNRILNEFKKFDVHSRYAMHIILNGEESTNQTENTIIENDYAELLNKLIESLSPRQKEIFQLNRIQGYTYKEISEILKISINTVREHGALAMEKMEKIKKYLSNNI